MIRCGVTVEVAGKKMPTASKDVGLQLVDQGKATFVRVLGFRREFRFFPRDIKMLVTSRVDQGQLAIVGKEAKVQITKANPEDLAPVVACLQGAPVAPVGAAAAATGAPVQAPSGSTAKAKGDSQARTATAAASAAASAAGVKHPADRAGASASKRARLGIGEEKQSQVGQKDVPVPMDVTPSRPSKDETTCTPVMQQPKISFAHMPTEVLEQLLAISPDVCCRQLFQACKVLTEWLQEKRPPVFRLGASRGANISPEHVIGHLKKRTVLRTLDLTGFVDLQPGASAKLADAIGNLNRGEGLQTLSLRGCKQLTDASVKRLLTQCTRLESLDLLDIPRLSNQALGVALPRLQILAAGYLPKAVTAERARQSLTNGFGDRQTVSVLGAQPEPWLQRQVGSVKFTATCLSALQPAIAASAEAARAGQDLTEEPSLTMLVLTRCSEIESFPTLPSRLQHLDLSFANLEMPPSLQGWRPLSTCTRLTRLNLAGNRLLNAKGLFYCIDSLDKDARLEVLDISSTSADATVFSALTKWPTTTSSLTHLRLASCIELRNNSFEALLQKLQQLQVFDIGGCRNIEYPIGRGGVTSAPKLRWLGIGQTDLVLQGINLDNTRRVMKTVAPNAKVVPGSLDVFRGYAKLPPEML